MGIEEIMVVLGGHSGNSFFHLLGDGHRFGLSIRYAFQEKAGGIAEALNLTKEFVADRNVAVILGDNVFIIIPRYCFILLVSVITQFIG